MLKKYIIIGDRYMDIRQLKYFIAITEEEQITKAAKKLHLAQPHLSRQLKLLEDELGVKLVERGSKKIQLTDAGKMLKNRAEQIIQLTESTVRELKDFNEGLCGTLRIGAVSSSGTAILNERISNFHRKYPGVNFEIWDGNTYKILELLNSGVIEIGIVRTPFDIDSYESILLPMEPMIAAMREDLYWEGSNTLRLEELKERPLIIYRRFEELILELCRKARFEPRIICKNDDARTTLLWADTGLGIAIVPKSAIKLVGSMQLKYKEIEEPFLTTQIAAIWMKDKYISPCSEQFLGFFGS
jgi:DNA-binding transcriptional LysR family regulator